MALARWAMRAAIARRPNRMPSAARHAYAYAKVDARSPLAEQRNVVCPHFGRLVPYMVTRWQLS